jgi:hypothetical protein
LPIKCAKCGYTRNKDEDGLCNLCGEVLVKGAAAPPEAAKPSATPKPPATLPPAPAPARPGDTDMPEPDELDEADLGPQSPPKDDLDASAAFTIGGLCHLKCSLLDRPLRLRADRAVTVGRVRENDICIPSQMVSRHHGKFTFEKGVWIYTDLKSSNGSRVNGKRVDRVGLQSGDVIDLGGFMITYKEIHDLSEVSDKGEEEGKTMTIDPSMLKRAAMGGMEGVAMLGGLSGSLAEISIPDILQLLENQRKTGTLTFDFEGAMGKIHIRAGMMVHAEYGRLTGEIAVAKMLQRTKGTFHMDPRELKTEVTIHRPTTTVLMDVARTLDERGNE